MNTGKNVPTAVTTANLRLREAPSLEGAPICLMPAGSRIEVYERRNGWARAKYTKTPDLYYKGWCSEEYLRY